MEVGQGIRTALAQIVSEVLGVPVSEIVFTEPDSDVTPFDSSTTSSRSTFHMGNAVKLAAEDVRDQLQDLGALAFGCPPEECLVSHGRVERAGHSDQSMSYEEVLRKQYGAGAGLTGKGFYYPPWPRASRCTARPACSGCTAPTPPRWRWTPRPAR